MSLSAADRPIRLGHVSVLTSAPSAALLASLPDHYHVVTLTSAEDARDLDLLWIDGAAGAPLFARQLAAGLPTVVRVRADDVFGDAELRRFPWRDAQAALFDSAAHEATLRDLYSGLLPGSLRTHVLPPAADAPTQPSPLDRTPTFNVGWSGALSAASAPLVFELLHALVARDARYQLHLSGAITNVPAARHLAFQAEQAGLDAHLHLYGALAPAEEPSFFAQCSHVVVADIDGAHPTAALRALAAGSRAVVRAYDGAAAVFPPELTWSTVGEAVEQITDPAFDAGAYRAFVSDQYSPAGQTAAVASVLDRLFADAHAERASDLFRAEPTHTGSAAVARYAQAVAHAEAGRAQEASDLMEGLDIASLDSAEHITAHLLGLQLALATDAPIRALAHADAATDLAPDEPVALNLAGRALWSAGHDRAGLELLIGAAERADTPGASLPFGADALRRDAFDAATAMGLDEVAAQFAASAVSA
jgi:hypothetical protein